MGLAITIIVILLGILAARPAPLMGNAAVADFMRKVEEYQGWLGVIALAVGLVGAIQLLIGIGGIFSGSVLAILFYLIGIANAAIVIALGILFGWPMVAKYMAAGDAQQKGEEIRVKLEGYKVMIGYAGIGLGLLGLVLFFL